MCGAFLFLQENIRTVTALVSSGPALTLEDNASTADKNAHRLRAFFARVLRLITHRVNNLNDQFTLVALVVVRWHLTLARMLSALPQVRSPQSPRP